ncbi:MAG: FAD-binding oxidoreductase, partial [Bacteroidales bacterium]|nr:FAD-binding oxidoreductase [Bacteroidales bacterium]
LAVDQFLVEDVRHLNESTYVLKFSKGGMDFIPGQHLNVGLNGSGQHREYSIYSGSKSDFLEILIKEVDDGLVSTQLKNLKKGSAISVKGPYGVFLTDAEAHKGKKILFIASGTGIAPFHSFIMSNPNADYKIIHGIRDINEAYDRDHYSENGYFSCTSRGEKGDFNGRLTDFLLSDESEKADKVYLCGNSSMIYDAMDILRAKGYRHDQIFTEVYF